MNQFFVQEKKPQQPDTAAFAEHTWKRGDKF